MKTSNNTIITIFLTLLFPVIFGVIIATNKTNTIIIQRVQDVSRWQIGVENKIVEAQENIPSNDTDRVKRAKEKLPMDYWIDVEQPQNWEMPDWIKWNMHLNFNAYSEASKEAGCPVYVIGAMHFSESGMSRRNPTNNQGLYGFYDISFSTKFGYNQDVDDEELKRQSIMACNHLQDKLVNAGLPKLTPDTMDRELIQQGLWRYNGTAYGSPSRSPYVVAKLRPELNFMRQCAVDGCGWYNIRANMGTFTFFVRMKIGDTIY